MPHAAPIPLLFDLDGTLVDSVALILASFRHAFATELGVVPPEEELVAGIGTPLVAQFRGFTRDEGVVERLTTAYRAFQLREHDRLLRVYDGVRDALAALKAHGHPTAIVTSKMNELAHRALRFAELDAYIDAVVGFDSCQRHKPHPEPVEIALRLLGARAPADAVFVGDSPHDVLAGRAAGVVTVAVLWGPFGRETLAAARPDYLVERVHELPPLVERIAAARRAPG